MELCNKGLKSLIISVGEFSDHRREWSTLVSCYLHCGHFIDLKSYFEFICYTFVSFNQIQWKRRQLDNVILAGKKKFIRGKRGNQTRFLPRFSGYKVAIIVEMGIKAVVSE